ncbi:hypothetical protein MFUM_700080 [Methylacidiphilum fumariolicum SolV]|uniref:Uncharacterized protein n=2 Tax=Candidatus Methylacidiphilum fumarolicum TaxID=591154 RepID=I0JZ61_METFB|nr:conserved protein of unknown function [Candidatus Methylacidiphilum fumarolicum]CCG92530.1 hypothetical protein MFUM_700080 [Methylacidiphilum fumariolicum SolV]
MRPQEEGAEAGQASCDPAEWQGHVQGQADRRNNLGTKSAKSCCARLRRKSNGS